jgi:Fe-S cluster assembly protein SufD
MEEKPGVVITRSRREQAQPKVFNFSKEMIPTSGVLADYRQKAWQIFDQLPFPTMRDTDWQRTDLREFPSESMRLPGDSGSKEFAPIPAKQLTSISAGKLGGQVLMTTGEVKKTLHQDLVKRGVIFTDLRTAEREYPELVTQMAGQTVRPEDGKFVALAAALSRNGLLLYIPKGVIVEQPLNSLLWGPGANLACLSHILIWLDEGASATYVHEASSPNDDGAAMHAGITEIRVGESASLRFIELQSWGRQVWNFSHERANVERNGNLEWIFGAIGSHVTKNVSELDLIGEGATGKMSGFYFADGNQHFDHDTKQNHLVPHTTSDFLFKGALKGHSRSIWKGNIYVAPGADKADGYQANRNLILSPEARADSIPGLEILADDVRCTHGATVGNLDQEPLFYLQTRGIPTEEAERLLVEGFFEPIMQRIPIESIRSNFQEVIHGKMANQ